MSAQQNPGSFETLLDEHRLLLLRVASTFARTSADRQDLAQEIAMQLWRAFPKYVAARAKFSTWMYRIALNTAISNLRRRRNDATEVLDTNLPDDAGGEDERLRAIYAFIGRLEPLNRALMMLYLEDRPYAEIAEVLGISESNVATKINRIKQHLRRDMAPAGK